MALNIERLIFVHEDMEIRNPTESDCGRFEVPPSEYSFVQQSDGAWRLQQGTDMLVLEGTTYSRFSAAGELLAQADLSEVEYSD
ncbi:hypothetical protein ABH908_000038 [Pseudomonas frederiksbergensis]|uniref:hypothetical protein n=1 Tax=Pseudomonas TaxID=286 RepID=UPI003D20AD6E